jgi:outer membrane biosynthesis protein TonB
MPIPEHNTLGTGFERRLKAALDKVTPPSPLLSSARYRSGAALLPRRAWRLVPVLVAVTAAGAALTAAAATGSPNPVVWTERAGSAIESVSKPAASPKAAPAPRPQPSRGTSSGQGTGPVRPTPSGHEQEPQRSPEPTERPEAPPQPQPSPSPRETPEPSPTPDSSNQAEPTQSPSPDGQSNN